MSCVYLLAILIFQDLLADRTNGRAYATASSLSVCDACIVVINGAYPVLEQKLLYRKSHVEIDWYQNE